ncbi:MAG: coenzyme F430 synthase [Methanoculleaceae archaeon]
MKILVLDTIHGGDLIAGALRPYADQVDAVDVYRSSSEVTPEEAERRYYDLVIAPVHLIPTHPLFRRAPEIASHHDAARWLLERRGAQPHPFVEITGARGKTTTAHALAHLMPGEGVLHTSVGTCRFPDGGVLWRRSITPASVIDAAVYAGDHGLWCIAEESLGVCGAGDLAILTSPDDYPVAGGMRRALDAKLGSLRKVNRVLLPPEITGVEGAVRVDEIVSVTGTRCNCCWDREYSFENPLLQLNAYRMPLALAAAAACLLGLDPTPLAGFQALPGRLSLHREGSLLVVDNSNSGACARTAVEAAELARSSGFTGPMTLVIGAESETVCEGFPAHDIASAVEQIGPDRVILVGDEHPDLSVPVIRAPSFEEGGRIAREVTPCGCIVLSVKTWR